MALAEKPNWEHGQHSIGGRNEFEVKLEKGATSRLHLISFSKEVEQEEIAEVVKQQKLRGVTQEEWKSFITNPALHEDLKKAKFEIALMFTGQQNSYNRFAQTVIYNPTSKDGENEIAFIENWTTRYWPLNVAFMFAEKKPVVLPAMPTASSV